MNLDLTILELLASKICHDLVSPVGAINNGIELIEEVGGTVIGDAMKLIGSSASLANHRLRLFRLLYGRGGSDPGLKFEEACAVMTAALPVPKIMLDWPKALWPDGWSGESGAFKVALNVILLSEDCLPHGGRITMTATGAHAVEIKAAGRNAALTQESLQAMAADYATAAVTPRTIQAYYTAQIAGYYGFKLAVTPHTDGVSFQIAAV